MSLSRNDLRQRPRQSPAAPPRCPSRSALVPRSRFSGSGCYTGHPGALEERELSIGTPQKHRLTTHSVANGECAIVSAPERSLLLHCCSLLIVLHIGIATGNLLSSTPAGVFIPLQVRV